MRATLAGAPPAEVVPARGVLTKTALAAPLFGLAVLAGGPLACGGRAVGCFALEPCGTQEEEVAQPEPERAPEPSEPPTAAPVTCGDPDERLWIIRQAQIDALEGCQLLLGSVRVSIAPDTDLSPLQSLQRIEGGLFLHGSGFPPVERGPLAPLTELRSVWALSIEGLATEVIDFLPRLERIASPAEATGIPGSPTTVGSSLTIREMPRLRHVLGLERVSGFVSLELAKNPQLSSFRGPTPAETPIAVSISNNLSLTSLGDQWPTEEILALNISLSGIRDLSALSGVRRIGELRFTNVNGLEDFEGLSSLRSIGQLRLRDTELRSLRGLEGLSEAESIVLAGNQQLEDASALRNLQSLGSLEVSDGNLLLRALPEFPLVENLRQLRLRGTLLEQGPLFPGVQRAELVLVDNNTSLAVFEGLPSLEVVDTLGVFNNPELVRLSFENLAMSTLLDVYCNERLLPDSWQPLQQVESSAARLFGNAGSDSPCPAE